MSHIKFADNHQDLSRSHGQKSPPNKKPRYAT